jgi:2-(3-amino-3-carboxypropyl)histidine synthase
MKSNRKAQIEKSLVSTKTGQNSTTYGLILSTLGRQGSPKILDNLMKKLDEKNKTHFLVLMSEIFPDKLKLFEDQIDT